MAGFILHPIFGSKNQWGFQGLPASFFPCQEVCRINIMAMPPAVRNLPVLCLGERDGIKKTQRGSTGRFTMKIYGDIVDD